MVKFATKAPAVGSFRAFWEKGRLMFAMGLAAILPSIGVAAADDEAATSAATAKPAAPTPVFQEDDEKFLDQLEQRGLRYFIEHSDPVTGLTRDRAPADGSGSNSPASIAASGFALTAWCIGDSRGWVSHEEVVRRTIDLLRFVRDQIEQEHGWIYHFVDPHTGKRMWRSEASTIDTALFLKGALMAREYLADREVTDLVDTIYARIDWQWALNGGTTLSHGWRPESGFIKSRWDSYSELLGLYLLGIGAPSHALPAETWRAWNRGPVVTYHNITFIQCPPLFTHQYPQAWFDFRGRSDGLTDYWQNSVNATLAQREWCAEMSTTFARWSHDLWGVTASDSAHGYVDWGGPTAATNLDGTVVPCAPGGSLPFAPHECMRALRTMREVGGDAIWGRYGFADAFNPQTGWVSRDVIAIDVGITMLMAENVRTGFVWRYFMKSTEARRGLELAGFKDVTATTHPKEALLAAQR
ncbi:MAG TPA: glucoamylase family protein [Opitutaceae bacterium]|nr:glucoamylase family protein [Opitutaceae bacterium]